MDRHIFGETPDQVAPETVDEIVPSLKEQEIPTPSPKDRMLSLTDEEGDRQLKLDFEEANQSYLARRKDSDALIGQCREQNNCNPRVAAWGIFVDTLSASHFDAMARTQAVNTWVNEAILYFDNNAINIKTASETLFSGTGICSDIARLKYETLKAIGINENDMRLVDGAVFDGEDKFIAYHEVLLVNIDGKNLILNDNVIGGHFLVREPLLHGGIEPADLFILGQSGGSTVNNFGHFIPLSADSEGGTKSYPTSFNEKGRYILPISARHNTPRLSTETVEQCTDDGRYCIDTRKSESIISKIAEATRLRPSFFSNGSDGGNGVNPTDANRSVPNKRVDSRSQTLKLEMQIVQPESQTGLGVGDQFMHPLVPAARPN